MSDEITSVNDIVLQHAEKIKSSNESGENSSPNQNTGGENQGKGDNQSSSEEQAKLEADKKAADEAAKADADKKQGGGGESKPDPVLELLKELKFESLDDLKAHVAKKDKVEETAEQKKRNEEVYRANLQSFAVENQLMGNEDFVKLETLKSKADKDLVFEKFSGEIKDEITEDLKAENPEVTEEEISQKIKEAFEKEYPLESKNQKAKTRAESKIANEAKAIRGPLESSFTTAKGRFDEEREVRQNFPKYMEKLSAAITSSVPEKLNVYSIKDGDEDINVEVPLTEAERKAVIDKAIKKTSTHEMYQLYKAGKVDEMAEILKEETDSIIWKEYRQKNIAKVAEDFLTRGTKKGSKVGAENPFPVNQTKAAATEKKTAADKQQEVIDSLEGKKT